MLLDDAIMADGEAQASTFASRLRCEEGIEHLFLHLKGDTSPVIADRDLHSIAEAFCRRLEGRLITTITDSLHFSLHRSMKAIGNHVQEHTCNLLREDINLASRGIKGAF